MRYEALLFDFDGTLLNTNELILQSFHHVLNKRFPGQYQVADCAQFIGPSLKQTFDALAPSETEQLIATYRAFNEANHDTLITEYPHVVETLTALKAMGAKLAIVSTKRNDMIELGLQQLGITALFDVKIGSDDVRHVKPHPEPVELALRQLGVTKDKALMIGDNSHDIEAGNNAGVASVGVAWALKGESYLRSFNPTYIVQDMRDFIPLVKGE